MSENLRPPVVVVVGHVDHGKTSLLDYIRETSLAKKEVGGITQSIGASTVTTRQGKQITFIDTPGHALFANMRSRGVNLADIGILVVAADDGVQPQTKEALNLLRESGTPFVVALTKIDMPSANIETALASLEREGVYFEKRGGDISFVSVSSKTGEGVTELMDLIGLLSEVNEVKGDETGELNGFVIETSKDKRGMVASIVVKNGQVKLGDMIYAGKISAKVKGIFDENQNPVKQILPGYAGVVLGFGGTPSAGALVSAKPVEDKPSQVKNSLGNADVKAKIFVKAKTAGSLEALLTNIPQGVSVLGSGVGDVTAADVFFAKSSGASIFLFEAKCAQSEKKLAETEGVKIERFEIVYDLLDKLSEIVVKGTERVVGEAQIVAAFPFNGKKVAGCKIIRGVLKVGIGVRLMRAEKELGKVKIVSIRKQKDEVSEVKQGEECGILFGPQLDFGVGDVLLSVE